MRPLRTMVAPHSASARAIAEPMPAVEPVTTAVLRERSMLIGNFAQSCERMRSALRAFSAHAVAPVCAKTAEQSLNEFRRPLVAPERSKMSNSTQSRIILSILQFGGADARTATFEPIGACLSIVLDSDISFTRRHSGAPAIVGAG